MTGTAAASPATVWTVGHSTRTWADFLAVLADARIQAVADVRRFPGSRRHPWFAGEALARQLPVAGIDYHWLPQLGGRRRPRPDSPNGGWRNPSFQGYADHLDSAEFADGLARLLALAARRRTAILCAEALWWRCHRALIADVLALRGIEVLHILDAGARATAPVFRRRPGRGRAADLPAAAGQPVRRRPGPRRRRARPPRCRAAARAIIRRLSDGPTPWPSSPRFHSMRSTNSAAGP